MRKPTFSENLFDQIKGLIDYSRQRVAASVNAELYLRWLDRHDRQEGELPPIGLLLCSEGNTRHIELLLLDQPSDIRVAHYLTELPSKEWFQQKLHRTIELAPHQLARS